MAKRYSGQVVLDVKFVDAYNNYLVRIKTPSGSATQEVGVPPALRVAVDSAEAYDGAAHAALSFAAEDNPDIGVEDYADFNGEGSGWWVGRSEAQAWHPGAINRGLPAGERKRRSDTGYDPDYGPGLGERTRRRSNPGGKHLAGANAKQQRQYEHIKASLIERGYDLKTAKSIAAASVNKGKQMSKRLRGGREGGNVTVATFLDVLASKIVQYDKRQSSGKHYNPNALGLYLERFNEVRDALAGMGMTDRGDAEALDTMRNAVAHLFAYDFPPAKNVKQQIFDYIQTGKRPSLVKERRRRRVSREGGGSTVKWSDLKVGDKFMFVTDPTSVMQKTGPKRWKVVSSSDEFAVGLSYTDRDLYVDLASADGRELVRQPAQLVRV